MAAQSLKMGEGQTRNPSGRKLQPPTLSQRRGLSCILAMLLIVFAIRLMMNRQTVPDSQPGEAPLADQLADRLDPNTASGAELAAISRLGEIRAAAIVEYRRRFLAAHPGQEAFRSLADLQRVKGIGPATAEMLAPSLVFPPSGRQP